MKNSLQIIAVVDQPELLEEKIELLADRHHDQEHAIQNLPANRIAFETSSVEIYVKGYAVMNNPDQQVSIPFLTCFVFTCVKRMDSVYKLEWSSSLS